MFQEHDDAARIAAVFRQMQREVLANGDEPDESAFALQLLEAIRVEFGLDE
jgi:hypothetical protein